MKFFEGGIGKLAASVLTKDNPAYVQYYVTARCNLTCEQCNVIYANADQEEASLEDAKRIAENLAKIGTSVCLLTGGEPFVRNDIIQIAEAMIQNGIHPRLQTNGIATKKQLEDMAKIGAHDISISLDSLIPGTQNTINGGFDHSWKRAIETIANVNATFPQKSFASFGCVLAPRNIPHIPAIIKFATKIGWWVSLVPAHTTPKFEPRSFSTYDTSLRFMPEQHKAVWDVLQEAKKLRDEGYNLYDSDEYLDDIYRFVTDQPIQWRRRNDGRCDSPNLYFAIQPNGDMAVCCDYRMPRSISTFAPDFPQQYRALQTRAEAKAITGRCSGCMYGSFPEITISSRFLTPMMHRAQIFLGDGLDRNLQRFTADEMVELAHDMAAEHGLMAA